MASVVINDESFLYFRKEYTAYKHYSTHIAEHGGELDANLPEPTQNTQHCTVDRQGKTHITYF